MRVEDGSPASDAGLQQGDIITKVGDVTLDETHSYVNTLFTFKPGDTIDLTVMRDGKEVQMQIILGEAKHT
jgi:S1-C subfamily serine protease